MDNALRTVLFQIWRRTFWLYLAGGVVLAAGVDLRVAALNRVNVLKPHEQALEVFENGGAGPAAEDLDGGLRYYRRLETLIPDSALVPANKGFCYYYRGDVRRAMRAYRRAAALEPDLAPLFWDMGMIHADKGRDLQAREALERFLSLAPAFQQSYGQMGRYYQKNGPALGLALVGRLYERDRRDREQAYAVLTALSRRQGEVARGQAYAQEGLKLFPSSPVILAAARGESPGHGRLHLHSELLALRYLLNAGRVLP